MLASEMMPASNALYLAIADWFIVPNSQRDPNLSIATQLADILEPNIKQAPLQLPPISCAGNNGSDYRIRANDRPLLFNFTVWF